MSNLMRSGDWDNRFLNDYGNALVATEKKMKLPGNYWNGGVPPVPKMNFIGEDFGRDPMTGFMTGLAASPHTATEFFNTTQPTDNAQYVLGDRQTFDDTPLNSKDGNSAREATGAALVSAATGVNPNDPTARPADLTPEHRQVLDRSLKYLSERGDDFPSEMRDDMAKILSTHSDVVHHSASSLADDSNDPRLLDRHQLLEVSKQVSRDQDSYGMLNEAMNREMIKDIHADHPSDPKENLLRAGATVGFLEEARYQALKTDKDDPPGTPSGSTTASAVPRTSSPSSETPHSGASTPSPTSGSSTNRHGSTPKPRARTVRRSPPVSGSSRPSPTNGHRSIPAAATTATCSPPRSTGLPSTETRRPRVWRAPSEPPLRHRLGRALARRYGRVRTGPGVRRTRRRLRRRGSVGSPETAAAAR